MARRLGLFSVTFSLALLASLAPIARADETIATVARPTPISAAGGRLVWSEFDATRSVYVLMTRAGDVTSPVPVRPRTVPFDVDVGPGPEGQVIAAYSRCRTDPPRRNPAIGNAIAQLPQWSGGRGCDLYEFDFNLGRESRIASASSRGGSEFLPTIWRSRIAFARVYERRRGLAGKRAYIYVRRLKSGGHVRRLPAGTRSSLRFCGPNRRPPRCPLIVEPGPTALDLAGTRLAFGWDSGITDAPVSSVYLTTRRTRGATKKLLGREASGDIQGAELESPVIFAGSVLWTLALFGDETRNGLERYAISNGRRDEATLPTEPASLISPILASAVGDAGVYYLLSGRTPSDPVCTPLTTCIAEPGCEPGQACQLRLAPTVAFGKPR